MIQELNRREFLKLLGLVTATFTASSEFTSLGDFQTNNQAPNILILVFDALSAGHMSLYGYPRNTTPNIENFADRAYVYHNHYASGNFTSPGTASLLTGVYPWRHKAINLSGTVSKQFTNNNLFSLCGDSHYISTFTHNTWAEILLSQFNSHVDHHLPSHALGIIGNIHSEKLFGTDFPTAFWSETILRGYQQNIPGSIFFQRTEFENLKRIFSKFAPIYIENYPNGPLQNYYGIYFILEHAIDWIQHQLVTLPQNFLAYYHLWPPHAPYKPRSDFINQFDDGWKPIYKPEHPLSDNSSSEQMLKDRQDYDEFIALVDSEFGRLVDYMDENGVFNNTIVILTSDHGELFERGIIGHSTLTMYQNLLRAPLLISVPYQEKRQDIFSPTSCVDLLPTILQISGHQIPNSIEGKVLTGFNNSIQDENRSLFAVEAKSSSKFLPFTKYSIAMIKGRYKLISYLGYGIDLNDELYDLVNDPEELNNLNRSRVQLLKDMKTELIETLNKSNESIEK
ncbi:MAG: sulfatase family protein [Candidatus Kariarchaeaceae archaeon]|jgi:arylsulfatase A-like enzyme